MLKILPLVALLAASCASREPVTVALSGFEPSDAVVKRLEDRLVASGRFKVVSGAQWLIHGSITVSQIPLIRARIIRTEDGAILFMQSRPSSDATESCVAAAVDDLADAIIDFQP